MIYKVEDYSKKIELLVTMCISCDNGEEEPPVPISNTEVKLFSAEDTWWETARENRSLQV